MGNNGKSVIFINVVIWIALFHHASTVSFDATHCMADYNKELHGLSNPNKENLCPAMKKMMVCTFRATGIASGLKGLLDYLMRQHDFNCDFNVNDILKGSDVILHSEPDLPPYHRPGLDMPAHASGPPKITLAPRDKKVLEEGKVSFFCRASGNPAPSFHWKRLGKRVNARRNRRYEVIEAPHISVLRIHPVKAKKDNSTFTCVANNGLGEARADAQLKVIPKAGKWVVRHGYQIHDGYPRIETHPKLRSVEKDRSVLLKCDAKGDPKPSVMWLKDGLPVDTSDPRINVMDTDYLQIRNSKQSDEATYECVAENEHGVAYSYRAMIYIKVRRTKFSSAPKDEHVMPYSDLNLTCVAVGSPTPFVKWRQGAQYLTGDDNIPIGKSILQLVNVVETKNYTCEASSGYSHIEHHVQVIVDAPGSAPENIIARAASSTTVVVQWDEPKIPNGIIQGYKLFYTEKPEDPIFFWEQQEVKSDKQLTTIVDLNPNETYTISMLAYSSIGQGPMSQPIQVLTTQGGSHLWGTTPRPSSRDYTNTGSNGWNLETTPRPSTKSPLRVAKRICLKEPNIKPFEVPVGACTKQNSSCQHEMITLFNGRNVLCDVSTEGGGWIVVQKRLSNTTNFNRNWYDYKIGFGKANESFWMGLQNIYRLCPDTMPPCELRLDYRIYNMTGYSVYKNFVISGEKENYKISIAEHSGNYEDFLVDSNNKPFTARYRPGLQDIYFNRRCLKKEGGGWWFHTGCYSSTRLYSVNGPMSYVNGILYSEVKVRRQSDKPR